MLNRVEQKAYDVIMKTFIELSTIDLLLCDLETSLMIRGITLNDGERKNVAKAIRDHLTMALERVDEFYTDGSEIMDQNMLIDSE